MKTNQFIPDGEADFAVMAQQFAGAIASEPKRYALSGDDAARVTAAVEAFKQARVKANDTAFGNKFLRIARDEARVVATDVIQEFANLIRPNRSISAADKLRLGMKERAKRLAPRKCPQTRPMLTFKGAIDADESRGPVHILECREETVQGMNVADVRPMGDRAKPRGATHIELYMELVDEGEAIPTHPGELSGGRPWFLRGYSRAKFKVNVPVCARPMKVVYWACWANTQGERGPFSKTCVARVEGWADARSALPEPTETRRRQQRIVITTARRELPEPKTTVEQLEMRAVKLLEDAA